MNVISHLLNAVLQVRGSILPGWLAHGLANLIAFGYLAFLM